MKEGKAKLKYKLLAVIVRFRIYYFLDKFCVSKDYINRTNVLPVILNI
jgi:hypothetical protein